MEKYKFKRLKKSDWNEIKILLQDKKTNISQICRDFKISRNSLYSYANKRGWFNKKETLLEKMKRWLKK